MAAEKKRVLDWLDKDEEEDEDEEVQICIDPVSEERAWCMFATAVLPESFDPRNVDLDSMDKAAIERAATIADKMLILFKDRFRAPIGEDEDEDEDEKS